MAKNRGNLSHHEQLRLDYLQKNIHYLNEKEVEELAFLEYKLELPDRMDQIVSRKERTQSRRHHSRPSYQDTYKEEWEEEISSAYPEEEPILPDYPREERRTKKKAPRVKRRKKGRVRRFFKTLLLLLVLLLAALGFVFFKGLTSVDQKPATEIFHGEETADGVNILILGTDGRVGDSADMTRTDSIMVLNINNSDKKVKLVSFMRDTLVNIEGYDYKLNVAYTFGEQNGNQGAENVRQVLKDNFDIDIKYYALVDFSTFATVIDTLFPNGVTIDAQFATVDGEVVNAVEVPDDLNMVDGVVPNQTIHVGVQQMDGRTLLNYARFRKDDSGDYGRTLRQQEVLSAVMTQIKDPTKLFSGAEALGKVYALTSTSVPASFMLWNGPAVALDGANEIVRVTIPENNDWENEYDIYGGLGIKIDFEKYKQRLAELGLR